MMSSTAPPTRPPSYPTAFLAVGISAVGLLVLVTAMAWWWVIYSQVVSNNYMSYPQAAPCMIGSTDLCNLAQALCKGQHFLGITRYSPILSWFGLALIGLGLTATSFTRKP